MRNTEIIEDQANNKLTLTIDLSKDFGPSRSGKTIIVASSDGNQQVGSVMIGVNIYKRKQA